MNQSVIEDTITFEPMRQRGLSVEAQGRIWILHPDLLTALASPQAPPDLPTIDW